MAHQPNGSTGSSAESSSMMTSTTSIAADSQQRPKKQRQTRIPEHLKAVKKASSAVARASKAIKGVDQPWSAAAPPGRTGTLLKPDLDSVLNAQQEAAINSHSPTSMFGGEYSTSQPAYPLQSASHLAGSSAQSSASTSVFSPPRPRAFSSASAMQSSQNQQPYPYHTSQLAYTSPSQPAVFQSPLGAANPSMGPSPYHQPGLAQGQAQYSVPPPLQVLHRVPYYNNRPPPSVTAAMNRSYSTPAYSQPEFQFSNSMSPPFNGHFTATAGNDGFVGGYVAHSSGQGEARQGSPPGVWPINPSPQHYNAGAAPQARFCVGAVRGDISATPRPLASTSKSAKAAQRSAERCNTSSSSATISSASTSSSSRHSQSSSQAIISSPRTPSSSFSSSLVLSTSSTGKACLAPASTVKQRSPTFSMSNTTTPMGMRNETPRQRTGGSTMSRSNTSVPASLASSRPGMLRSNTMDPRMTMSTFPTVSSTTPSAPAGERNAYGLVGSGRDIRQGKVLALQDDLLSAREREQAHFVPQMLDLDIEMDLAAAAKRRAEDPSSSFSNVTYPIIGNHALLTPPQSAEMGKQTLPGTRPVSQVHGSNKLDVAFYPEKERFQSSWKFPSGTGLNLAAARTTSLSASSSPSSSSMAGGLVQSAFPSMTSLNASIGSVMKDGSAHAAGSEEMSRRQSRIQAWLDSPDMQEGDETGRNSWSVLPKQDDRLDSTRPNTASSNLELTVSPASIMTRTASEMKFTDGTIPEEYEEFEVMHATGKSVHALKVTRKRRLNDEEDESPTGSLTDKDRNALKAGLGLPFQATAPGDAPGSPDITAVSPGKRNRTDSASGDLASSPAKRSGPEAAKGRKGRRSKKKALVMCPCQAGDDGEAMIACDTCSGWYHIACMHLDDENLPDEWFCKDCQQQASDDGSLKESIAIPKPSTPPSSLPTGPSSDKALPSTPKGPGLIREPTFSNSITPKSEPKRQLAETLLVLAPSPPPDGLSAGPSNAAHHSVTSHGHSASFSRAYAPQTPRVGSTAGGQRSAPNSSYQWESYSPRTPSNGLLQGRRLSKTLVHGQPGTWAGHQHWSDLPPASMPAFREEDGARARQWEQYYNTPAPTSNNPIPFTPPLQSHTVFSANPPYSPALDTDTSVSQRFLAIHSTPSTWAETSRFPNNLW